MLSGSKNGLFRYLRISKGCIILINLYRSNPTQYRYHDQDPFYSLQQLLLVFIVAVAVVFVVVIVAVVLLFLLLLLFLMLLL